ncbi:MAG: HEAT repeat domain-containing protein [Bacteroidales bacterium]|nr:HEAT repeat domain-containing protein [Bacteroidales bacterium]
MSFRTKLKKYSDKFVVMSWNSDIDKKYNSENICDLLRNHDDFARYCGVCIFKPNDLNNLKFFYKLINDNQEIIRYAVTCKLADIKNNKSVKILIEKALNDDCRYVQTAALRSLRKIGDESVVEKVYPLLSNKWHNVRLEAAKALYFLDKDESIEYILDLLNDKSKMNRLAGIKFIRDHLKDFDIYAVGPLQAVEKNDRINDVRKEAGKIKRDLLDMVRVDNVWNKIISSEYDQSFSIVASISDIDDAKATEILSKVLEFPFVMEKEFDFEEEEEIKSVAIDFFMKKYQNTGDRSFLDELFSTLLNNYNNSILLDHIVSVLSMCGLDDVLKKAEFLLLENLDYEDYANLLKIIISIGGDAAIDVLNDFFEQYSDDFCHTQDIFFYDDEANELFDLLSNSKNAKAHKLLANFLESEFYEFLDVGLKKKCIIAAGTAKAAKAINNLSDILLNKDEDMSIRRKAAQALGAIGTKRASAALNKVGNDDYASNHLKKVAKSLRSKIK